MRERERGRIGVVVSALIVALCAAVAAGVVLSGRPDEGEPRCGPFGRRASIALALDSGIAQVRSAVSSGASAEAKRQEVTTFAARVDGLVHRFALLSGSADTEKQDRALAGALGRAKDAASSLAIAVQGQASTTDALRTLDAAGARIREANVTAPPC